MLGYYICEVRDEEGSDALLASVDSLASAASAALRSAYDHTRHGCGIKSWFGAKYPSAADKDRVATTWISTTSRDGEVYAVEESKHDDGATARLSVERTGPSSPT